MLTKRVANILIERGALHQTPRSVSVADRRRVILIDRLERSPGEWSTWTSNPFADRAESAWMTSCSNLTRSTTLPVWRGRGSGAR